MLKQLSLSQFKKFLFETINFQLLTLLTGVNGMGKSSVIQAILVLRQSYDRGDLPLFKRITIYDKDLADLISPDDMLCTLATTNKVKFELSDDQGFSGTWEVIAEGTSNTLPLSGEKIDGSYENCSVFKTNFQYLNAERIGPRRFYDKLSVARPHSVLGTRGEFTASVLLDAANKLTKVSVKTLHLPGQSTNVYDLVSAWISKIIYPGTKIAIDGSDPTQIKLEYTFEYEKRRSFNPVNIGFGFSFALPVIVAVLTAEPGSLLVVENPEAHLHPRGQAAMGSFLALAAQGGIQILTETHSDHILNGVRLSVKRKEINPTEVKIIFLGSKQQDGHEAMYKAEPQIDENGKITEWPRDFFDTWEYSMMELL
jgi:predicted ATPase